MAATDTEPGADNGVLVRLTAAPLESLKVRLRLAPEPTVNVGCSTVGLVGSNVTAVAL